MVSNPLIKQRIKENRENTNELDNLIIMGKESMDANIMTVVYDW